MRSFPQAGIHLLTAGDFCVYVRAGKFRFRPSQADQLDVQVWYRGEAVTLDRGTYAYTCPAELRNLFAFSRHHNTIVLNGGNHMKQLSRFLWVGWNDAVVVEQSETSDTVSLTVQSPLQIEHATLHRRVDLSATELTVTDEVSMRSPTPWTTKWQLPTYPTGVSLVVEGRQEVKHDEPRAANYRQLEYDVNVVTCLPDERNRCVAHFVADEAQAERPSG